MQSDTVTGVETDGGTQGPERDKVRPEATQAPCNHPRWAHPHEMIVTAIGSGYPAVTSKAFLVQECTVCGFARTV